MIPDSLRSETSGAEDSLVDRPEPDGSERVYVESTTRSRSQDRLTTLLVAYKWPIVLSSSALWLAVLLGWIEVPEIPPEVVSIGAYLLSGSIIAIPAGWYLVEKFRDDRGVEVLDLDPVGDDHRHLRIGRDLWDSVEVRSPWGSETSTSALRSCSINGRTGYEVMGLRVEQDGTLVVVSTALGDMSAVELRTYESALEYAQTRLSRRANRGIALRANLSHVAREAAERVVLSMVRTSEESGMPDGDRIEETVDDVLGSLDLGDDPEVDRERDRDVSIDSQQSVESRSRSRSRSGPEGSVGEAVEQGLFGSGDADRLSRTDGSDDGGDS